MQKKEINNKNYQSVDSLNNNKMDKKINKQYNELYRIYKEKSQNIYKVFQNRIETFKEYVEMYEDNEEVELYLYDFIAYVLANNNKKRINYDYIYLFNNLFKNKDNENNVVLKGKDLKLLADFTKKNGLPKELEKILIDMYILNEEKRELKYKENYKYYNNNKEYEYIKEASKEVDNNIKKMIEKTYLLNDKLKYEYEIEKNTKNR